MRFEKPLHNAEPLLPLLQEQKLLATVQGRTQRLSVVRKRKGRGEK